ncbi:membrane protein insertion efficiency factor YidD [Cellulomonas sp. HZM]|uniref:membrane protein insertion efficiency factor YidD n=1 Tax=Cellulomonas sp. HZM TaxID=1454010 RepID=UPI0006893902|nr:membrane protein insertion efficiency factor YidD [Cellulomonas sp. HZM]
MTVLRKVLRSALRVPGLLVLGLLRLYQRFISPMTPPTCRFYPSCSQYAVIAVQRHGAVRGTWLAARRLLRCHPWNPGGVDDVPPAHHRSHTHAVAQPTH